MHRIAIERFGRVDREVITAKLVEHRRHSTHRVREMNGLGVGFKCARVRGQLPLLRIAFRVYWNHPLTRRHPTNLNERPVTVKRDRHAHGIAQIRGRLLVLPTADNRRRLRSTCGESGDQPNCDMQR